MSIDELFNTLKELSAHPVDSNYQFIESEGNPYYAIDKNGFMVFGIESMDSKTIPQNQHTDLLLLRTNSKITIEKEGSRVDKTMHLLICSSDNESELKTFLRLTSAFNYSIATSDRFIELFTSLTNLFKLKGPTGKISAEGLFGELYLMYYLDQKNKSIFPFWQKNSRMKFDFMLDGNKRLDVKTSDSRREHHFIHEQLDVSNYDIIICSILVRPSNTGTTLAQLVEYARQKYIADYDHLLVIEEIANRYSDKELQSVCFDTQYLEDNIRFYDANNVPSFPPGTPDYVSKVNYNSDLTALVPLDINDVLEWL